MPLFGRSGTEARSEALERALGPVGGAIAVFVLEIVQIAVLALAIIIPVRYFLVQPFIVKGASMEPNFHENEYLIIDELSYRFREPMRGEVVVFHPPGNDDVFYIKRVIGLPGETVEIKDGEITISNSEFPNGIEIDEEYIEDFTSGLQVVTLGPDEFYLLGDNRDASLDSRFIGAIPRDHLTGRVWLRGLPLDKIGSFSVPDYELLSL
ncbi:signal peptidase I [Patescibacteria group bacterium]|nr:signal peptidase I [Patescibacteria group bacterium]